MTALGRHAVVAGIGAWVPPRVVTNAHLSSYLDTSDRWIVSRTGIRTRHWVDPGTSTSDLAVEAGSRALANAARTSGSPHSPDAVVVATTTPDWPVPATAPTVATRLGLAGAAAYDVAATCSSFVYGLATATGLIATGSARQVLVVGAETYSTILNPKDRTTAVIFGDGAGAVLLRAGAATELGAVGPCDLGSDGAGAELAMIPAGGSRQRTGGSDPGPEDHFVYMRGNEIYRHAVERMVASAHAAIRLADWQLADVDRIVPHQANDRICAAVAERLDLAPHRLLSNIAELGNTAAASIPLLLNQAAADGRLTAGAHVVLVAFGGGLTWGATTLTWPQLATPEAVSNGEDP